MRLDDVGALALMLLTLIAWYCVTALMGVQTARATQAHLVQSEKVTRRGACRLKLLEQTQVQFL